MSVCYFPIMRCLSKITVTTLTILVNEGKFAYKLSYLLSEVWDPSSLWDSLDSDLYSPSLEPGLAGATDGMSTANQGLIVQLVDWQRSQDGYQKFIESQNTLHQDETMLLQDVKGFTDTMMITIVYNLLFKSCRVDPPRLRKTEESMVNPPIIYLYYLCLHWFVSKSVVNRLYLYFQYCFCSASGSLFSQFRIHFQY
jgi:hypothetical protein